MVELYHYLTVQTVLSRIIRKLKIGSYNLRVQIGAVERPWYGHCVYYGAMLAKKLGYKKISVLEYGVAGGAGLINLEYHAAQVSKIFSLEVDIYGFDSGKGLPKPLDYRDIPYQWKEGFYEMNVEKLEVRLNKARLIIGDIRETSKTFFEKYNPAPIAAIMYDFDYYSSTAEAFKMLSASDQYFLPRVNCYFDDTIGNEIILYNDYTGARLAINEFNQENSERKFGIPYHLIARNHKFEWYYKIFTLHLFKHRRYNDFVGDHNQQLSL